MSHTNPLKQRNPDLHRPKATPSELSSRISGLESRYATNKQLIGFLKTYGEAARLLHREYSASRAYPECCANFFEAERIASEQSVMLREVQLSLQKEIDELRGQLPMFKVQR